MADLIAELEISAQIVLSPPNLVTGDQRRQAEEFFLKFRKTKSPYALCKHIFETSKVEYVLYQTAVLLREAIIREWASLGKQDIQSLRSYLLHYILENASLQNYVREQMLRVIAIVVKRDGVTGSPESGEEILAEVSRLITSGNMAMQNVGCSILNCLLNEYATSSTSSDVGLTWETHFQAKRHFESKDLKRIFQFTIQVLSELELSTLNSELMVLFNRFLGIAEQILSWNFIYSNLPRKVISVFEADQSPYLRPGPSWRDTILDKSVIELFFKVHFKIRNQPEIAHHSLNCLIQLGTLHGTVFTSSDDRLEYLMHFLQGLFKLLTSGSILPNEIVGIANLISKLVLFFPSPVMLSLPAEILNFFLEQLTLLTCAFCRTAAVEEARRQDDHVYMEGFERLLDAWTCVMREDLITPSKFSSFSVSRVFETFVQCHVAPPEGTRAYDADDDEIYEIVENDRARFKNQLAIIGVIGRSALEQNLLLLTRLLESRANKLRESFRNMRQASPSDCHMALAAKYLVDLYEDIHWLVLISGHLLAYNNGGETILIPSEITHYSIKQSPTVDIDVTLKVLTAIDTPTSDIPGCEHNADHVVRLVAVIFRLCEIEKSAIESKLFQVLSPEMGTTLMWFLAHWALPYLLPDEKYYTELSKSLVAAFGRDTPAGEWILGFLLEKINSNLTSLTWEPTVVESSVQLLVALVDSKERCATIVKSGNLWTILQHQAIMNLTQLPKVAKRNFLKALVLTYSVIPDSEGSLSLLLELLKPLQEQLKNLVMRGDFRKVFHEQHVKMEIIHLLEAFTGVSQGCDAKNSGTMFAYLLPILNECVSILDVYHNYQDVVELVLELFCETTQQSLCYLPQADCQNLYPCCLSMIQTFAKYNTGIQTREKSAEEDQYRDILLLMELLTNLVSKDFIIDYFQCSSSDERSQVSAADIALLGLNIIMPMMNAELLRFPCLCLQYFKMVTFVCEFYPEKVCHLPEGLLRNLIASIELALGNFGTEVVVLCMDFLSTMAMYMFKTQQQGTLMFQLVKPFLKIIFHMALQQTSDIEVNLSASSTLYALICCYQQSYNELMQELLTRQSDPVYYQRFLSALNGLMADICFNDDRQSKLKFRDNFEAFIIEVRAFLCVK